MQEFSIPRARRMRHRISHRLWILGRLLGRNDDLAEIRGVSRKQQKGKGVVSGRAVQAEGTAWLRVLKQEGAQLVRVCPKLEGLEWEDGWQERAGSR